MEQKEKNQNSDNNIEINSKTPLQNTNMMYRSVSPISKPGDKRVLKTSNSSNFINLPNKPLNSFIIPKSEVIKTIDNFKILNKIIELNIGPNIITIESSDLQNFKILIFNLMKNFNKNNLEKIFREKYIFGGDFL